MAKDNMKKARKSVLREMPSHTFLFGNWKKIRLDPVYRAVDCYRGVDRYNESKIKPLTALAETAKIANAPAGNRTRDPSKRGSPTFCLPYLLRQHTVSKKRKGKKQDNAPYKNARLCFVFCTSVSASGLCLLQKKILNMYTRRILNEAFSFLLQVVCLLTAQKAQARSPTVWRRGRCCNTKRAA